MLCGECFHFVDTPLREIDLALAADVHIPIRNAEGLLRKVQLALLGTANNQNHMNPPQSRA